MAELLKISMLISVMTTAGSQFVFPQQEFEKNIQRRAREVEAEKRRRPREENKLLGSLYAILRLAEEADTSMEKRKELDVLLTMKDYRTDAVGRIRVVVNLRSASDATNVISQIRSNGGAMDQAGEFPFVIERLQPKKLRVLIQLLGVVNVEVPDQGTHNQTGTGNRN